MSLLKKLEKSVDSRLRGIFAAGGAAGAREAIVVYRDAIELVTAKVSAGKRGERLFPFNRITVTLSARDAEHKAVLQALFETEQLTQDLHAAILQERADPPADLTVVVHFLDAAGEDLRVDCERTEKVVPVRGATTQAATPAVPLRAARLVALTGAPCVAEFDLDRFAINIGRENEVLDPQGRPIRRNELFFPEAAHEANATVSRRHAHVQFDSASGDWRIYDDGSSTGTSLFRNGRRVDVPIHGTRGVGLKDGDEIYLGQARLRFEMPDAGDTR